LEAGFYENYNWRLINCEGIEISRRNTKMSPIKTSAKKRKAIRYRQQTPKGKRVLRWIIGIIILVILFIFLSGNRSLIKLYSLHLENDKLEQQREELLRRQKDLEIEIDKLKNDPEHIEGVAREKYNMKKENEEVHIVEPK
jgi:cell division protein FtsB